MVRATERSADTDAVTTVGNPALAGALERLDRRRYTVEASGRSPLLSRHLPVERVASSRGSTA